MEISVLVIPFHQIIKVWLVQLTRLYKATGLSYKVTKPYKVAKSLCEVMELCNTTDEKNINAKFWQFCVNRMLYAPKFWDVALLIIRCKENWLQWTGLLIKEASCKSYESILSTKSTPK